MNFQEIKAEILRRAIKADACRDQYRRCLRAETEADLLSVVCDNFCWCVKNGLDGPLLQHLSATARHAAGLFINENGGEWSVGRVFLLGNATVTARGNATVTAWGGA